MNQAYCAVIAEATVAWVAAESKHGWEIALHWIDSNNEQVAAAGWASVRDYAELEVDGRRLVLCHYPFRSWNAQGRGALNVTPVAAASRTSAMERATSAGLSR